MDCGLWLWEPSLATPYQMFSSLIFFLDLSITESWKKSYINFFRTSYVFVEFISTDCIIIISLRSLISFNAIEFLFIHHSLNRVPGKCESYFYSDCFVKNRNLSVFLKAFLFVLISIIAQSAVRFGELFLVLWLVD